MWPFRRSTPNRLTPNVHADNRIAAGSTVRGDLAGKGSFVVEGRVEGAIETNGPVFIGEGSVVEGGVRGSDVVVLGAVRGDVRAAGHLEIGPKGKVVGDVWLSSLTLHPGGVFYGTSRMAGAEELLALPPRQQPGLLGAASDAVDVGAGHSGRTLPPPDGAVPPPPGMRELPPLSGPISAVRVPEGLLSHERLVTASGVDDAEHEPVSEDEVVREATG